MHGKSPPNSDIVDPDLDEDFDQIEVGYVSYEALVNTWEEYETKHLVFRGKVLQVTELPSEGYILLVEITEKQNPDPLEYDFWDDIVRVDYEGFTLFEDDIIEFIGWVDEPWTYTTVLGTSKTVPWIHAVSTQRVMSSQWEG